MLIKDTQSEKSTEKKWGRVLKECNGSIAEKLKTVSAKMRHLKSAAVYSRGFVKYRTWKQMNDMNLYHVIYGISRWMGMS